MRELVFRAIRRSGERPASGRAAMLGLADDDAELARAVRSSRAGPARSRRRGDRRAAALLSRLARAANCRRWSTPDEWPALLERAPLDLRVNVARTDRDAMAAAFAGAEPTPLSPWGLRLPPDTRVDDHPAFADGLVEVQDEGSQLIALACAARGRHDASSTCAPAPAARRWRWPRPRRRRRSSPPTPTARACRSLRRAPSGPARRSTTRLLDGGREAEQLADLDGQCRRRAGRCAVQRVAAPGGAIPKGAGG